MAASCVVFEFTPAAVAPAAAFIGCVSLTIGSASAAPLSLAERTDLAAVTAPVAAPAMATTSLFEAPSTSEPAPRVVEAASGPRN